MDPEEKNISFLCKLVKLQLKMVKNNKLKKFLYPAQFDQSFFYEKVGFREIPTNSFPKNLGITWPMIDCSN